MKKLNVPKINIQKLIDKILAQLKLIVLILAIAIIVFFGWFLYKHFYLTIISAKEVANLKSEVTQISIDAELLETVNIMHDKKTTLPSRQWSQFNYLLSSSPQRSLPSDDLDTEVIPAPSF